MKRKIIFDELESIKKFCTLCTDAYCEGCPVEEQINVLNDIKFMQYKLYKKYYKKGHERMFLLAR